MHNKLIILMHLIEDLTIKFSLLFSKILTDFIFCFDPNDVNPLLVPTYLSL